ncbi:MAG: ABC transporter permease [Thermoleophilia bacterium]
MEAITTPHSSYSRLSGFVNILRSEFCKLRSVRSTFWTLFLAVVFNIGLAAILAIFLPGRLSAHEKATIDPIRLSLGGIHLSQVAFGVLGVLVITREYTTGMIRATLSAVPQRRVMLAAKTIVFAATALSVGIFASFAAYFVFQAFISGESLRSSIGDPGVLRAVTGGGLYLTVLGLFGLGLGAIIRSSAGAIAALLGGLFVPQLLTELLPQPWKDTIGPYLPMQAGSQILALHQEAGALGAWSGFGVFCLYAVVALAAGFVLINHRDA